MSEFDKKNNVSLFRKLTNLFRGGPVIKKKIRTADTTIAMPDKVKSSGALLFQKSISPTYSTITANAYNLSERLARYQDFCFGRDTLVYTLEGVFTIEDLSKKYPNGEQFFVYSYDYEKKTPTIGTAFFPRVANDGVPTKICKVTFDDGGYVHLTPDHKVILRDGTTKEVKDLQVGDSLMPLYVSDINGHGYNWVYMLGKKTNYKSGWLQEHVFVASHFVRSPNIDECVHHKDFNRKNNHPSNLLIMQESEHQRYHAQINNVNKLCKPNQRHSDWMRENGNRRHDLTFQTIVSTCLALNSLLLSDVSNQLGADVNAIKLRLKEAGFKNWEDFSNRFAEAQQLATHEIIARETKTPTIEEIFSVAKIAKTLEEASSRLGCTRNAINRRLQAAGYKSWVEYKTGTPYAGKKRGPKYDRMSFQAVCSFYKNGMTLKELAAACGTTHNKVMTCIRDNGYTNYSDWTKTFNNHKVSSIESIADDIVYTITVEKHHNLAVGSLSPKDSDKRAYSMVFCCQCEMEYTPEISSALDIYADESVASDDKGRSLHIYSENSKIKKILEELFYDTLNIEFNLRPWARSLVKFGDFFLYNDVSPNHGVINAFPIPVNEIEREENFDPNDPFAVRYRWVTLGNRILENWEVTHFRLLGNDMFLPYGSSVIESARRIWRQLILIEDAMLVYRVVRAPERRVFYVDVGNVPAENVPMYVEEQRKNLRTSQVVERTTGRVDLRYNPMSVDEDYIIPVRGQDTGTRIDTLQGGQNTAAVEDVAYIQKKLFAALKIPRAYLGYDEMLGSKATLAQEDIRFSRTINVIQKTLIAELNKLAIVHLFANGYRDSDLLDFTLRLSNPSTVAQQQKLELWRTKFELAGSAPEGMVDKNFIRKNIWGLNDEECEQIDRNRMNDKVVDAEIEAGPAGVGGEAGGEEMGAEDLFGGGEEAAEPEATEELPPEENAGEEPEEEENDDTELLTSGDNDDKHYAIKIDKNGLPVKMSKHLKHQLYNRERRRTHGASKTHMPDYGKMVSHSNKSNSDPFDTDFLKSVVSNPLGESRVPKDLMSVLNKFEQKYSQSLAGASAGNDLLIEGEDIELPDRINNNNEIENVFIEHENEEDQ